MRLFWLVSCLVTLSCFCSERGQETEEADLNKILHLDGGTYDAAVIIVLIQAINHAIDHRSQISTVLSQQDFEPPDLDGWSYNDAMH